MLECSTDWELQKPCSLLDARLMVTYTSHDRRGFCSEYILSPGTAVVRNGDRRLSAVMLVGRVLRLCCSERRNHAVLVRMRNTSRELLAIQYTGCNCRELFNLC
jgi:hypothetical protein